MDLVGDGLGLVVVCFKVVDRVFNSKVVYVMVFILVCGEFWGLGGWIGEIEGVWVRWDGLDVFLCYKMVFKVR